MRGQRRQQVPLQALLKAALWGIDYQEIASMSDCDDVADSPCATDYISFPIVIHVRAEYPEVP